MEKVSCLKVSLGDADALLIERACIRYTGSFLISTFVYSMNYNTSVEAETRWRLWLLEEGRVLCIDFYTISSLPIHACRAMDLLTLCGRLVVRRW